MSSTSLPCSDDENQPPLIVQDIEILNQTSQGFSNVPSYYLQNQTPLSISSGFHQTSSLHPSSTQQMTPAQAVIGQSLPQSLPHQLGLPPTQMIYHSAGVPSNRHDPPTGLPVLPFLPSKESPALAHRSSIHPSPHSSTSHLETSSAATSATEYIGVAPLLEQGAIPAAHALHKKPSASERLRDASRSLLLGALALTDKHDQYELSSVDDHMAPSALPPQNHPHSALMSGVPTPTLSRAELLPSASVNTSPPPQSYSLGHTATGGASSSTQGLHSSQSVSNHGPHHPRARGHDNNSYAIPGSQHFDHQYNYQTPMAHMGSALTSPHSRHSSQRPQASPSTSQRSSQPSMAPHPPEAVANPAENKPTAKSNFLLRAIGWTSGLYDNEDSSTSTYSQVPPTGAAGANADRKSHGDVHPPQMQLESSSSSQQTSDFPQIHPPYSHQSGSQMHITGVSQQASDAAPLSTADGSYDTNNPSSQYQIDPPSTHSDMLGSDLIDLESITPGQANPVNVFDDALYPPPHMQEQSHGHHHHPQLAGSSQQPSTSHPRVTPTATGQSSYHHEHQVHQITRDFTTIISPFDEHESATEDERRVSMNSSDRSTIVDDRQYQPSSHQQANGSSAQHSHQQPQQRHGGSTTLSPGHLGHNGYDDESDDDDSHYSMPSEDYSDVGDDDDDDDNDDDNVDDDGTHNQHLLLNEPDGGASLIGGDFPFLGHNKPDHYVGNPASLPYPTSNQPGGYVQGIYKPQYGIMERQPSQLSLNTDGNSLAGSMDTAHTGLSAPVGDITAMKAPGAGQESPYRSRLSSFDGGTPRTHYASPVIAHAPDPQIYTPSLRSHTASSLDLPPPLTTHTQGEPFYQYQRTPHPQPGGGAAAGVLPPTPPTSVSTPIGKRDVGQFLHYYAAQQYTHQRCMQSVRKNIGILSTISPHAPYIQGLRDAAIAYAWKLNTRAKQSVGGGHGSFTTGVSPFSSSSPFPFDSTLPTSLEDLCTDDDLRLLSQMSISLNQAGSELLASTSRRNIPSFQLHMDQISFPLLLPQHAGKPEMSGVGSASSASSPGDADTPLAKRSSHVTLATLTLQYLLQDRHFVWKPEDKSELRASTDIQLPLCRVNMDDDPESSSQADPALDNRDRADDIDTTVSLDTSALPGPTHLSPEPVLRPHSPFQSKSHLEPSQQSLHPSHRTDLHSLKPGWGQASHGHHTAGAKPPYRYSPISPHARNEDGVSVRESYQLLEPNPFMQQFNDMLSTLFQINTLSYTAPTATSAGHASSTSPSGLASQPSGAETTSESLLRAYNNSMNQPQSPNHPISFDGLPTSPKSPFQQVLSSLTTNAMVAGIKPQYAVGLYVYLLHYSSLMRFQSQLTDKSHAIEQEYLQLLKEFVSHQQQFVLNDQIVADAIESTYAYDSLESSGVGLSSGSGSAAQDAPSTTVAASMLSHEQSSHRSHFSMGDAYHQPIYVAQTPTAMVDSRTPSIRGIQSTHTSPYTPNTSYQHLAAPLRTTSSHTSSGAPRFFSEGSFSYPYATIHQSHAMTPSTANQDVSRAQSNSIADSSPLVTPAFVPPPLYAPATFLPAFPTLTSPSSSNVPYSLSFNSTPSMGGGSATDINRSAGAATAEGYSTTSVVHSPHEHGSDDMDRFLSAPSPYSASSFQTNPDLIIPTLSLYHPHRYMGSVGQLLMRTARTIDTILLDMMKTIQQRYMHHQTYYLVRTLSLTVAILETCLFRFALANQKDTSENTTYYTSGRQFNQFIEQVSSSSTKFSTLQQRFQQYIQHDTQTRWNSPPTLVGPNAALHKMPYARDKHHHDPRQHYFIFPWSEYPPQSAGYGPQASGDVSEFTTPAHTPAPQAASERYPVQQPLTTTVVNLPQVAAYPAVSIPRSTHPAAASFEYHPTTTGIEGRFPPVVQSSGNLAGMGVSGMANVRSGFYPPPGQEPYTNQQVAGLRHAALGGAPGDDNARQRVPLQEFTPAISYVPSSCNSPPSLSMDPLSSLPQGLPPSPIMSATRSTTSQQLALPPTINVLNTPVSVAISLMNEKAKAGMTPLSSSMNPSNLSTMKPLSLTGALPDTTSVPFVHNKDAVLTTSSGNAKSQSRRAMLTRPASVSDGDGDDEDDSHDDGLTDTNSSTSGGGGDRSHDSDDHSGLRTSTASAATSKPLQRVDLAFAHPMIPNDIDISQVETLYAGPLADGVKKMINGRHNPPESPTPHQQQPATTTTPLLSLYLDSRGSPASLTAAPSSTASIQQQQTQTQTSAAPVGPVVNLPHITAPTPIIPAVGHIPAPGYSALHPNWNPPHITVHRGTPALGTPVTHGITSPITMVTDYVPMGYPPLTAQHNHFANHGYPLGQSSIHPGALASPLSKHLASGVLPGHPVLNLLARIVNDPHGVLTQHQQAFDPSIAGPHSHHSPPLLSPDYSTNPQAVNARLASLLLSCSPSDTTSSRGGTITGYTPPITIPSGGSVLLLDITTKLMGLLSQTFSELTTVEPTYRQYITTCVGLVTFMLFSGGTPYHMWLAVNKSRQFLTRLLTIGFNYLRTTLVYWIYLLIRFFRVDRIFTPWLRNSRRRRAMQNAIHGQEATSKSHEMQPHDDIDPVQRQELHNSRFGHMLSPVQSEQPKTPQQSSHQQTAVPQQRKDLLHRYSILGAPKSTTIMHQNTDLQLKEQSDANANMTTIRKHAVMQRYDNTFNYMLTQDKTLFDVVEPSPQGSSSSSTLTGRGQEAPPVAKNQPPVKTPSVVSRMNRWLREFLFGPAPVPVEQSSHMDYVHEPHTTPAPTSFSTVFKVSALYSSAVVMGYTLGYLVHRYRLHVLYSRLRLLRKRLRTVANMWVISLHIESNARNARDAIDVSTNTYRTNMQQFLAKASSLADRVYPPMASRQTQFISPTVPLQGLQPTHSSSTLTMHLPTEPRLETVPTLNENTVSSHHQLPVLVAEREIRQEVEDIRKYALAAARYLQDSCCVVIHSGAELPNSPLFGLPNHNQITPSQLHKFLTQFSSITTAPETMMKKSVRRINLLALYSLSRLYQRYLTFTQRHTKDHGGEYEPNLHLVPATSGHSASMLSSGAPLNGAFSEINGFILPPAPRFFQCVNFTRSINIIPLCYPSSILHHLQYLYKYSVFLHLSSTSTPAAPLSSIAHTNSPLLFSISPPHPYHRLHYKLTPSADLLMSLLYHSISSTFSHPASTGTSHMSTKPPSISSTLGKSPRLYDHSTPLLMDVYDTVVRFDDNIQLLPAIHELCHTPIADILVYMQTISYLLDGNIFSAIHHTIESVSVSYEHLLTQLDSVMTVIVEPIVSRVEKYQSFLDHTKSDDRTNNKMFFNDADVSDQKEQSSKHGDHHHYVSITSSPSTLPSFDLSLPNFGHSLLDGIERQYTHLTILTSIDLPLIRLPRQHPHDNPNNTPMLEPDSLIEDMVRSLDASLQSGKMIPPHRGSSNQLRFPSSVSQPYIASLRELLTLLTLSPATTFNDTEPAFEYMVTTKPQISAQLQILYGHLCKLHMLYAVQLVNARSKLATLIERIAFRYNAMVATYYRYLDEFSPPSHHMAANLHQSRPDLRLPISEHSDSSKVSFRSQLTETYESGETSGLGGSTSKIDPPSQEGTQTSPNHAMHAEITHFITQAVKAISLLQELKDTIEMPDVTRKTPLANDPMFYSNMLMLATRGPVLDPSRQLSPSSTGKTLPLFSSSTQKAGQTTDSPENQKFASGGTKPRFSGGGIALTSPQYPPPTAILTPDDVSAVFCPVVGSATYDHRYDLGDLSPTLDQQSSPLHTSTFQFSSKDHSCFHPSSLADNNNYLLSFAATQSYTPSTQIQLLLAPHMGQCATQALVYRNMLSQLNTWLQSMCMESLDQSICFNGILTHLVNAFYIRKMISDDELVFIELFVRPTLKRLFDLGLDYEDTHYYDRHTNQDLYALHRTQDHTVVDFATSLDSTTIPEEEESVPSAVGNTAGETQTTRALSHDRNPSRAQSYHHHQQQDNSHDLPVSIDEFSVDGFRPLQQTTPRSHSHSQQPSIASFLSGQFEQTRYYAQPKLENDIQPLTIAPHALTGPSSSAPLSTVTTPPSLLHWLLTSVQPTDTISFTYNTTPSLKILKRLLELWYCSLSTYHKTSPYIGPSSSMILSYMLIWVRIFLVRHCEYAASQFISDNSVNLLQLCLEVINGQIPRWLTKHASLFLAPAVMPQVATMVAARIIPSRIHYGDCNRYCQCEEMRLSLQFESIFKQQHQQQQQQDGGDNGCDSSSSQYANPQFYNKRALYLRNVQDKQSMACIQVDSTYTSHSFWSYYSEFSSLPVSAHQNIYSYHPSSEHSLFDANASHRFQNNTRRADHAHKIMSYPVKIPQPNPIDIILISYRPITTTIHPIYHTNIVTQTGTDVYQNTPACSCFHADHSHHSCPINSPSEGPSRDEEFQKSLSLHGYTSFGEVDLTPTAYPCSSHSSDSIQSPQNAQNRARSQLYANTIDSLIIFVPDGGFVSHFATSDILRCLTFSRSAQTPILYISHAFTTFPHACLELHTIVNWVRYGGLGVIPKKVKFVAGSTGSHLLLAQNVLQIAVNSIAAAKSSLMNTLSTVTQSIVTTLVNSYRYGIARHHCLASHQQQQQQQHGPSPSLSVSSHDRSPAVTEGTPDDNDPPQITYFHNLTHLTAHLAYHKLFHNVHKQHNGLLNLGRQHVGASRSVMVNHFRVNINQIQDLLRQYLVDPDGRPDETTLIAPPQSHQQAHTPLATTTATSTKLSNIFTYSHPQLFKLPQVKLPVATVSPHSSASGTIPPEGSRSQEPSAPLTSTPIKLVNIFPSRLVVYFPILPISTVSLFLLYPPLQIWKPSTSRVIHLNDNMIPVTLILQCAQRYFQYNPHYISASHFYSFTSPCVLDTSHLQLDAMVDALYGPLPQPAAPATRPLPLQRHQQQPRHEKNRMAPDVYYRPYQLFTAPQLALVYQHTRDYVAPSLLTDNTTPTMGETDAISSPTTIAHLTAENNPLLTFICAPVSIISSFPMAQVVCGTVDPFLDDSIVLLHTLYHARTQFTAQHRALGYQLTLFEKRFVLDDVLPKRTMLDLYTQAMGQHSDAVQADSSVSMPTHPGPIPTTTGPGSSATTYQNIDNINVGDKGIIMTPFHQKLLALNMEYDTILLHKGHRQVIGHCGPHCGCGKDINNFMFVSHFLTSAFATLDNMLLQLKARHSTGIYNSSGLLSTPGSRSMPRFPILKQIVIPTPPHTATMLFRMACQGLCLTPQQAAFVSNNRVHTYGPFTDYFGQSIAASGRDQQLGVPKSATAKHRSQTGSRPQHSHGDGSAMSFSFSQSHMLPAVQTPSSRHRYRQATTGGSTGSFNKSIGKPHRRERNAPSTTVALNRHSNHRSFSEGHHYQTAQQQYYQHYHQQLFIFCISLVSNQTMCTDWLSTLFTDSDRLTQASSQVFQALLQKYADFISSFQSTTSLPSPHESDDLPPQTLSPLTTTTFTSYAASCMYHPSSSLPNTSSSAEGEKLTDHESLLSPLPSVPQQVYQWIHHNLRVGHIGDLYVDPAFQNYFQQQMVNQARLLNSLQQHLFERKDSLKLWKHLPHAYAHFEIVLDDVTHANRHLDMMIKYA